jgi:hypothetical protein
LGRLLGWRIKMETDPLESDKIRKFKIGDYVKVKMNNKIDDIRPSFTKSMMKEKGHVFKIIDVIYKKECIDYRLEGSYIHWSNRMLKKATEKEIIRYKEEKLLEEL